MDFTFGLFMGVFALPFLLWGALSWWMLVIVCGGLASTQAVFYHEKHMPAFWILMLVFVFASFMMTDVEVDGFFASIIPTLWATARGVFWGLLNYVILGMVAAVPLWLWFVRKFYIRLRADLTDYIKTMSKHQEKNAKFGEPLSADEKKTCKSYKSGGAIPDFLRERWGEYRTDHLRIEEGHISVANHIDEVASMIFLWPFHIITLTFGDFLAQIPKLFVQYFGKVLDWFARIARYGIPAGIDAD